MCSRTLYIYNSLRRNFFLNIININFPFLYDSSHSPFFFVAGGECRRPLIVEKITSNLHVNKWCSTSNFHLFLYFTENVLNSRTSNKMYIQTEGCTIWDKELLLRNFYGTDRLCYEMECCAIQFYTLQHASCTTNCLKCFNVWALIRNISSRSPQKLFVQRKGGRTCYVFPENSTTRSVE